MPSLSLRNPGVNVGNIIAKVKMLRQSNPDKTCLLVEGYSDTTFFNTIIDKKKCKVIDCDGKPNVIAALKTLIAKGIKGIVGIFDRDYDNLINQNNETDCLFETDANDMESMILGTKAFRKIINMYGDLDKISTYEDQNGKTILEHITNVCSLIGEIRLANAKYDFNLNFKQMKLDKYITQNYDFERDRYIDDLIFESGKETKMSKIKVRIAECANALSEKWDLCRGHDVTHLLNIMLTSDNENTLGNSTAFRIRNLPHFEQNVIIAYDLSDFQRTSLFEKILNWQKNSNWPVINEDLII